MVPLEMSAFLFNVQLPSSDADAMAAVQSALDHEYHIYFVFGSVVDAASGEPLLFTRLSAQVYLELDDFRRFGELVLQLLADQTK